MIRRLLVLGFVLVLMTSLIGTAIAGPDKTGQAIAFARVDGSSGAVTGFGGKGTTSASGARNSAGSYTVTFTGHFPKSITPNLLIINTTAESNDFGVSNGVVIAASATEIEVDIATWVSSVLTETDNNCFVSVFFGR
ncbi:MAG: hypothetical protein WAU33_14420 [Candidatus Binataceae bacterium]